MSVADSVTVIQLAGELEIGRKDEIQDALAVNGNESGILIDFSGVTYADSTSLAALLKFRNDAHEHRIPLAMIVVGRQFARLIQYAGLNDAFEIFDNRAAALTYLMGEQGKR